MSHTWRNVKEFFFVYVCEMNNTFDFWLSVFPHQHLAVTLTRNNNKNPSNRYQCLVFVLLIQICSLIEFILLLSVKTKQKSRILVSFFYFQFNLKQFSFELRPTWKSIWKHSIEKIVLFFRCWYCWLCMSARAHVCVCVKYVNGLANHLWLSAAIKIVEHYPLNAQQNNIKRTCTPLRLRLIAWMWKWWFVPPKYREFFFLIKLNSTYKKNSLHWKLNAEARQMRAHELIPCVCVCVAVLFFRHSLIIRWLTTTQVAAPTINYL